MEKKTTCGIVYRIKNSNIFLVGHATNSSVWSIPKGIKDTEDVNDKSAACRELKEETSLILYPNNIEYIGTFPYLKNKDMALFYYEVDKENAANITQLFCSSCFPYNYTNKKNEHKVVMLPEIDRFLYIDIKDITKYCNTNMSIILENNIEWM